MTWGYAIEEEQKKLRSEGYLSGEPIGLALSGGGIRSATFNLGLIQALAKKRVLTSFSYLSTVSGGGYIGSWLMTWAKQSPKGMETVQTALSSANAESGTEAKPVAWLRTYSNYLTPRKGLLTLDTLTGITYQFRNVFLSSLVLTLFVSGVLSILAGLVNGVKYLPTSSFQIIFLFFGSVAAFLFGRALARLIDDNTNSDSISTKPTAFGMVLAILAFGFCKDSTPLSPLHFGLSVGTVYFLGVSIGSWMFLSRKSLWDHLFLRSLFAGFPIFAIAGFLLPVLLQQGSWNSSWELAGFGVPLACLLFALAASVHLGVIGRLLPDEAYFWISRLAGRLLQYSLIWSLPFLIFLLVLPLIDWTEHFALAGGTSVVYAFLVRWLAAGSSTGGEGAKAGKGWKNQLIEGLVATAPYLLMLLLVGFMALGVRYGFVERFADTKASANTPPSCTPCQVVVVNTGAQPDCQTQKCLVSEGKHSPYYGEMYQENLKLLEKISPWWGIAIGLVLAEISLLLSHLIDANLFSLHGFYRNRLTNAYLGASNPNRRHPPSETGVDPGDSPKLADLVGIRPYFLINTTLNLTGRKNDLAWQNRQGAAFLFSPLYCGFSAGVTNAYKPTKDYGKDASLPLKLDLAMTISGAAASPLEGFHTKPGLSMLLALLGARLGWWLTNPAKDEWNKTPPKATLLTTLYKEMTAQADASQPLVNLSDGGHFENLGIYELVRRRCTVILASDAGADPDYVFDDLGNAIHKIRTDFGVEIDIDPLPIRPAASSNSTSGTVVGSDENFVEGTIRYSTSPLPWFKNLKDGKLIYLKASLPRPFEKKAADVLYYAATHPLFPQEPTSDQWFSEEQFEAYRKLGELLGESLPDNMFSPS
ncbi:MAG: hypothetical protein HQL56_00470 [Magnetococcales bacterium]|nr:hypothetical protein [Magnetococcales bacterium]